MPIQQLNDQQIAALTKAVILLKSQRQLLVDTPLDEVNKAIRLRRVDDQINQIEKLIEPYRQGTKE